MIPVILKFYIIQIFNGITHTSKSLFSLKDFYHVTLIPTVVYVMSSWNLVKWKKQWGFALWVLNKTQHYFFGQFLDILCLNFSSMLQFMEKAIPTYFGYVYLSITNCILFSKIHMLPRIYRDIVEEKHHDEGAYL